MFRYALIIFLFFINLSAHGEESQRSLKQQLDRLQRDVNDLSKLVFQKNIRNIENTNEVGSENSINISAFDMRIYDLEKDIKRLNLNIEEVIFQIDELKKLYEELSITINTNLINESKNIETSEISSNEINDSSGTENTLGELKINSENLSDSTDSEDLSDSADEKQLDSNIINLNPDEQFQIAFDLLRSQKFDHAKKSLEEFINNNRENQLAGSAYYWLGEIHLLKKEYREAALVFAEGYQKYPSSVKAPNNLYKLAEALSQIDKVKDACNTLNKFTKEHTNHKLINKSNNMIIELNCG